MTYFYLHFRNMRTCCVPGCKGRFSLAGAKVHKLPDTEPLKSQWIQAVPNLAETKVKTPSVCCLHFKAIDYGGKNKKYLKPDAVPNRHLNLKEDSSLKKPSEKVQVFDVPTAASNCSRNECQDLFLTVKNLHTINQSLQNHIRSLEKKVECLENQMKTRASKKDCIKAVLENCPMLGPTQVRCLTNNTTKGRGWTMEEKVKAMALKKMCNIKCYNYVRKNLVPLPCSWELNNSFADGNPMPEAERMPQEVIEEKEVYEEANKQEEVVEEEVYEEATEAVHHIVFDGSQKIEFIVTDQY